MPKQHTEHQVRCTDSTVTSPRCGLELTGEQTAFCTHFPWDEEVTPWWLRWLHVSLSVKTMSFLNSAKIPCIAYGVPAIALIESGPLTQHFSLTSLPAILSKSLILASLRSLFRYQHWLHGLQPALSQPRLTCLTLCLPHNLSLPLYMAPSFSFSPHPLHPAAHIHIRVTTFKNHYPQTCVQSSFVMQFWAFTDNLSTAPTTHAVLRTLISIPGLIRDTVTYLPGQQIKIWA